MKSFISITLIAALTQLGSGRLGAQPSPVPAAPAAPAVPALDPAPLPVDDLLPVEPLRAAPRPGKRKAFAQTARELDGLKAQLDTLAQTDLAGAQVAAERAQEIAAKALQEAEVAWAGAESPMVARVFTKDGARGKSLIIESSKFDRKEMTEMEEDLAVMARLLEKATTRKGTKKSTAKATAMGIYIHNDVFSGQPVQNLYLDGYGALFFLNVKFPLVAPQQKKEEAKEETAEDSDWNQTRKELYGRPEGDIFTKGFVPSFNQPAEEYDAEKVDKLQSALLEALKNGTNIRHLKPEEFITLTVLGPGNVSATRIARGGRNVGTGNGFGFDEANAEATYTYTWSGDSTRANGPDTVLTLRVKKADVDAFAKDKIKADEFRAKANVQTYTASTMSGGPRAAARTIVKDRLKTAPAAPAAPVLPIPKRE